MDGLMSSEPRMAKARPPLRRKDRALQGRKRHEDFRRNAKRAIHATNSAYMHSRLLRQAQHESLLGLVARARHHDYAQNLTIPTTTLWKVLRYNRMTTQPAYLHSGNRPHVRAVGPPQADPSAGGFCFAGPPGRNLRV